MQEKARVPAIRFAGFTDAWEQRKLGNYCDMFNGDRSSKYPNADDMVNDGIPFINAGDLGNGTVNLMTCNRISREKYNDLGGAKLQRGDIVYCLRGTLGKNAFIDNFDEGTVASSLVALRPKNIDGKYLYFILNSDIEYRQRIVRDEGAAQPNLSAKSVSEYIIPVPSGAEQQQVSACFSTLDHLITLHQHKCDETKELKRYMLQKMFPRNGKKNPEIRFAGFTDAWEQRKLEDISDVRDGTHDSPTYQNEGHPFVTSKNVKGGFINYDDVQYISDEDFEEINKRSKVDVNDILMGMIGTIGNLALIRTEPDFAIKNVALIKDTQQVSYLYLYHYLQSKNVEKQLLSGMDGGTQKFFALKKIRELNILVPSEDEQLQIGGFLENLDYLITLHQRKCDELREVKKFMLQNMFPQKG